MDTNNKTIDNNSVLPLNKGRIAYHSYSHYMGPQDGNDGSIFVYDLSTSQLVNLTGSLPVANAMNPHFSRDGSLITFTARPQDTIRNRESLEVFVYSFLTRSLDRLTWNNIPDEDPTFSPDGKKIVFKRNSQIWEIDLYGGGLRQITESRGEKSGPNYSPDGSIIIFWKIMDKSSEIWSIDTDGNNEKVLISNDGLNAYYPVFRDHLSFLYTRRESPADPDDNVYLFRIGSQSAPERMPFNRGGMNDSDPFPAGPHYIGFSSDGRVPGNSHWELFLGDPVSGKRYRIPTANDHLHKLGGCYSPYQ